MQNNIRLKEIDGRKLYIVDDMVSEELNNVVSGIVPTLLFSRTQFANDMEEGIRWVYRFQESKLEKHLVKYLTDIANILFPSSLVCKDAYVNYDFTELNAESVLSCGLEPLSLCHLAPSS